MPTLVVTILLLLSVTSCRNSPTAADNSSFELTPSGDASFNPVPGELAPNPSFENGGSQPDGWTGEVRATDAVFEWSSTTARSGSRSITVSASNAVLGGSGWPGWVSERFAIDDGRTHEVSIWYRTTTVALPNLQMDLYGSNGQFLSGIGTATNRRAIADGEWHMLDVTLDASDLTRYGEVAEVRILALLSLNYGAAGIPAGIESSITFDDVSLRAR